jgi:hypothetical protein
MNLMDDSLPIAEVGEWVHEKHALLRRYIDISREVRKRFVSPNGAGATFVDLYCGPGRGRIRNSDELVDGSPLVAAKAAESSGYPFRDLHIADIDASFVHASAVRLRNQRIRARVHKYVGPAADTARQVASTLDPYGLHFVFLDPYNLGDLPLAVIEPFAELRRADILIHVSAMDMQRNLEQAISATEGHRFDRFAPGWRDVMDPNAPPHETRRAIRRHWINLLKRMGLTAFEEQFTLVKGSRNQPLYWLAFAAKHERALEFWDKIRNVTPQRSFPF